MAKKQIERPASRPQRSLASLDAGRVSGVTRGRKGALPKKAPPPSVPSPRPSPAERERVAFPAENHGKSPPLSPRRGEGPGVRAVRVRGSWAKPRRPNPLVARNHQPFHT